MHGRRGIDDAIALVERRLAEALQRGGRHLPLKAAPHAAAGIADLAGLLSGSVDPNRTLALGRALMALDREKWIDRSIPIELPRAPDRPDEDWPDDAWLAIRLCALPWPLGTRSGFELDIGADPAIIRRLASGDAASAVGIALRRLGASGVRCTVRAGAVAVPSDTARLWASALAFPITKSTAARFLQSSRPKQGVNMTIDLKPLQDAKRLLFKIPLEPLLGRRFQPAGFPSLGAATFQTGDGDSLLVESAQSMANHLEMTIWDVARKDVKEEVDGLSHVRVMHKGEFLHGYDSGVPQVEQSVPAWKARTRNSSTPSRAISVCWKPAPSIVGSSPKHF